MTEIRKIRLSESITDVIKKMIAREGFKPGDKFYSELVLAKKLGVSRSSLREALKILEVTGQVTIRQGKGIFVEDLNGQQFKSFAAWLKNNEQSIKDNFEVRLIIEPKIAALAARHASSDDVQKMRKCRRSFAKYAAQQEIDPLIRCDREFHRLLAFASHNKTLYVLMKSMTTNLPYGWISSLHIAGRVSKTITEHEQIYCAVDAGDGPGAEQAMNNHLTKAWEDVQIHLYG